MLHLKTVEPNTFSVLKQLMTIPELQEFHLVGGTALSLMYGHRMSIDLDLFSTSNFNNDVIKDSLIKHFKESVDIRTATKFGILALLER